MFLTELHAHTSEVSPCAHQTARQVADRYLADGFSTVVVCNHFSDRVIDKYKGTWDEKIDFYLSGWKAMKDYAGDRLNVLLGCELRFTESTNDYLVFGMTERFLREHPILHRMTLAEFAPIARESGFLTVQAHPFRNGMMIMRPELLDGYEIFNGHAGHDSRNHVSLGWCRQYGKIPTSGSDFHDADFETSGGILTECPITSMEQLITILKSGEYQLRCTGTAAARDGLSTMRADAVIPFR